jgi:transposase
MLQNPLIDLWAMDEVRFAQYGSRCRMWVPPEVHDPVLLHYPTRKSVGYWGAVRLRDGAFVYRRETDSFNGQTCLDFLQQLSARSRRSRRHRGGRTVVIADNAKFHYATLHQAWRDAQAPEFALDFLPPYSPELNPIERVWKLTRRKRLHTRYFALLDEIISSVETQFQQWASPNAVLRRLCALT